MGRKKIYADDAARVAAFRAKGARLDIAVTDELNATLQKIAEHFEVSKSDVCNSLLRFALTNRDVYKVGLYSWKKR